MTDLILNFIAGRPVPAASGKTLPDVDPATGQVIAEIPRSNADDVAAAVAAAKAAQPAWAARSIEDRCAVLHRIADGLEAELEALAVLETRDSGKPITTSRTVDIPRAVRNFRFFADFARDFRDEEHAMPDGGHNVTHRRPVGIVGLITPWNLPLYLLSWKVAPALAMGNAIVAKPSEMTPATASALARIAKDAGLPDGLLNIVHGLGPEAGQAILEHPEIGAISFTGGTATGRHVAATAAPLFKKLSLELGGKNPTMIFADCDIETAVAGATKAGFTNTGQVCLCGSRILVEAPLYDAFVVALRDRVADMNVGDPTDPETQLGALISEAHREKVESYIQIARAEGTVTGGEHLHGPGAYLTPAVITDVGQDSRCVQEEIFGPVVTVQPFSNEAEAVRLANDIPYGLSASVWTPDADKAQRVAQALDVGMVWINDWLVRDLRVPFGGVKQSGVGREGGKWSLEFFSEAMNIYQSPA